MLKSPAAKVAKPKPSHPTYKEMIVEAIVSLKDRKGSSRQAIQKFIMTTYFSLNKDEKIGSHLKRALIKGLADGTIVNLNGTGASGSFKLLEKPKPVKKVVKKKPVVKKVVKKPAKAAKTAKPKAGTKKPAAKKPAAKKSKPATKKSPKKKASKKVAKGTPKKTVKPKTVKKSAKKSATKGKKPAAK